MWRNREGHVCRFDHIDCLDAVDLGGLNDEGWERTGLVLKFSVKEPDRVLFDAGRWEMVSVGVRERGGCVDRDC